MPMLGMAQDTGKLIAWHKSAGEAVAAGDVLFEVETDKSVSEVEAQTDGYLSQVQVTEGTDVPVGQVIAVIADSPDADVPIPQTTQTELAAAPVAPAEAPTVAELLRVTSETGNRVLASPKARRMAEDAGLDLSRLVAAGLPQPFHAADVSSAIAEAEPAQAVDTERVFHIAAQVPALASDVFIQRMRDEAGKDLSYGNLAIAFAARALRKATQTDTLTLSLETSDGQKLSFTDPDRMRLSFMTGSERADSTDLDIKDLGEGYLTHVSTDLMNATALTMSRTGDVFHLTLSYRPDQFTTDQANLMMSDFCERLAEPMLALV